MNPLIFTMCSTKFRASGILVVKLLFDQLVLILFYAVYVIYYAIVTFFKAIWNYLTDLATSLGSCNARCIKSVGKYDSLNDVVIKVTLTNSNEMNGGEKVREGERVRGGEKVRGKNNNKEEDCCEGDLWGVNPGCHGDRQGCHGDRQGCHGDRQGGCSGQLQGPRQTHTRSPSDTDNYKESQNKNIITPDNRTSETML